MKKDMDCDLIKIQKKSISNYNKMIRWAKKQKPKGFKHNSIIRFSLGIGWDSRDCPYCKKFGWRLSCKGCPLFKNGCCCSGLCEEMNRCSTWEEWVIVAEKMKQYIKENGLKIKNTPPRKA